MTDKQIILDMIKRATKNGLDGKLVGIFKGTVDNEQFSVEEMQNSITVNSGYPDFRTFFEFDEDGNLIFIGAYE